MICETCLKTVNYIIYTTDTGKMLCENCYKMLNFIDTTNIPQFF
jgi:hypothetical protein